MEPKAKKARKGNSKDEPLCPIPISSCPPVWPRILLQAASDGDLSFLYRTLRPLKELARMLDDGRDVAKTMEAVKENGRGALHLAAIAGKTAACKFFVEQIGIDINSLSDGQFETPIYLATFHGKLETATYLFHRGADPAKGNKSGRTPLYEAAGKGYFDFLRLLLSRQIYVDIEDSYGYTSLHVAAGRRQVSTTNILLEHKANPKKASLHGFTPLIMSVLAGSVQCVAGLILAGADVNDNNSDGVTPLGLAAHGGLTAIIELLLKAGADPNIPSMGKLMPIELAALFGKRHDVEILFPSTSPILSVPEWSVDGIITDTKTIIPKKKGKRRADKALLDCKKGGKQAYDEGDHFSAMIFYTMAMELDLWDADIYYSRSCCWHWLALGDRALMDASICRMLKPEHSWACFREGTALYLQQEYKRAAYAFLDALELEPANKQIEDSLKTAIESMKVCATKRR